MLKNLLLEKQSAIVERWREDILQAYPQEARGALRSRRNQFANPVGHTLARETEAVFGLLCGGAEAAEFAPHLHNILKIKAVQDFSPSQAVSFVFALKEIVRALLRSETGDSRIVVELMDFEARIDQLAMQAFDIYMKCREAIYELRVNEVKRRVSSRLARICPGSGDPDV